MDMMWSWCSIVSKFKAVIGSSNHMHYVLGIVAVPGYQVVCIFQALWMLIIVSQICIVGHTGLLVFTHDKQELASNYNKMFSIDLMLTMVVVTKQPTT